MGRMHLCWTFSCTSTSSGNHYLRAMYSYMTAIHSWLFGFRANSLLMLVMSLSLILCSCETSNDTNGLPEDSSINFVDPDAWLFESNGQLLIKNAFFQYVEDHPLNEGNTENYTQLVQVLIENLAQLDSASTQFTVRLGSDDLNPHPKIEILQRDFNQDDVPEILMIIGDEYAWEQLFVALTREEDSYLVRYTQFVGSRYEQPMVEVLESRNGASLIQLFHGGSAYPGSYNSNYDHFVYREDSFLKVLELNERMESTGTLGSDVKLGITSDTVGNSTMQELLVKFHFSFWLNDSRDLGNYIIGANEFSVKHPHWKSGEFELDGVPSPDGDWWTFNNSGSEAGQKNDAGIVLLEDSISIPFEWNEPAQKYVPAIQSGQLNPLYWKLELLQSENLGRYEANFYNAFKDDLMKKCKTANHEYRATVEFMEYWFGWKHYLIFEENE